MFLQKTTIIVCLVSLSCVAAATGRYHAVARCQADGNKIKTTCKRGAFWPYPKLRGDIHIAFKPWESHWISVLCEGQSSPGHIFGAPDRPTMQIGKDITCYVGRGDTGFSCTNWSLNQTESIDVLSATCTQ